MTPNITREDDLQLLLSPDIHPVKESAAKPKLTMKYLLQLIGEIQQDKLMLINRIDELEQQLYKLYDIRDEAAAGKETALPDSKRETEIIDAPNLPEIIQMTRSERHAVPKKKSSFRMLWFHRREI